MMLFFATKSSIVVPVNVASAVPPDDTGRASTTLVKAVALPTVAAPVLSASSTALDLAVMSAAAVLAFAAVRPLMASSRLLREALIGSKEAAMVVAWRLSMEAGAAYAAPRRPKARMDLNCMVRVYRCWFRNTKLW